jgi:hypothetical protein
MDSFVATATHGINNTMPVLPDHYDAGLDFVSLLRKLR